MFWVLCSGAPRRDLPERYGSWKTIYNRFNRWSKSGIINKIFNRLLSILDEKGLLDWPEICLDGSNIRASKDAAGAKKNIPISLTIMRWVAHAVVMAPKSTWQPTEGASHSIFIDNIDNIYNVDFWQKSSTPQKTYSKVDKLENFYDLC
ncbi:transposase [Photorhabdus temperata subsp. temperata M1021]|nr:transposase [Photorhabdus temperata subsp. temperata M1021]